MLSSFYAIKLDNMREKTLAFRVDFQPTLQTTKYAVSYDFRIFGCPSVLLVKVSPSGLLMR